MLFIINLFGKLKKKISLIKVKFYLLEVCVEIFLE